MFANSSIHCQKTATETETGTFATKAKMCASADTTISLNNIRLVAQSIIADLGNLLIKNQKKWKISTNKKLYDIDQLQVGKILYQSKGRARMRPENHPRIGDIAYIAYGGFRRALCIVESDNWINGNLHQIDPANRGIVRIHATLEKYAELTPIILFREGLLPLRGCQRTWSRG